MLNDKIVLMTSVKSVDVDGYPVETLTGKTVWAKKKSVVRSEFYAANAVEINAVIAFDVAVDDYDGQTDVVFGGKSYTVIRTYEKGDYVELSCTDKAV